MRAVLALLLAAFLAIPLSHPEARLGAEGLGGVAVQVTITGITCSPTCHTNTAANPGDTVGTLQPTLTGGPVLLGQTFTLISDGGSGMLVSPSGTVTVGGGGPPAANTYTLSVSVAGTNATTSPVTDPVSVSVASALSINSITTTPNPCTVPSGSATGTVVCTMTPVPAGGSFTTTSLACGTSGLGCNSNQFQVVGSQLQVGSAGTGGAGSVTPTITVTAAGATNSPDTIGVPVTISAGVINLVTPVSCTAIATSCQGTVGDTAGTQLGTLVPSTSGGSGGTITCPATTYLSGKFQTTTGCILETGPTPYTASGTYTVNVAFSGSSATSNPYTLSFSATVNPSGAVTEVQRRLVNNTTPSASPAAFFKPIGQEFAPGQVPAGDGVLLQLGTTTISSQADACVKYGSAFGANAGSLRYCSFYANMNRGGATIAAGAQTGLHFFDNPGAGISNSPWEPYTSILAAITGTNHDYRVEMNASSVAFSGRATGTTLTVTSTQLGTVALGQHVFTFGMTAPIAITAGSGTTWTLASSVTDTGPGRQFGITDSSVKYSFSVNNELANQLTSTPSHFVVKRSGSQVVTYYVYGEMYAANTFGGSTYTGTSGTAGAPWAMAYIDVRADGSIGIWSQIQFCRPLASGGTQIPSCFGAPLVGDSNGNDYALRDYAGAGATLMGCDANGCVQNGNAGGVPTVLYPGWMAFLVTPNAFGYDSQTDVSKIVVSYPLPIQSDPTTRGLYSSFMSGYVGYTNAEVTDIASTPLGGGTPQYSPGWCAVSPGSCHYGATGETGFIGFISGYFGRSYLSGTTTQAFREFDYDRVYATESGSVNWNFRDANSGGPIVLSTQFTPAAGTSAGTNSGALSNALPKLTSLFTVYDISGGISVPSYANAHDVAINHQPNFWYGTYLQTGEPFALDFIVDQCDTTDIASLNPGFRTRSDVNSTTFSAVNAMQSQPRQTAWVNRDCSNADWLRPDNLADGATASDLANLLDAMYTGPHGTVAFQNSWMTMPFYEANQTAMGWMFSGNPAKNTDSQPSDNSALLVYDDVWMKSYLAETFFIDVQRGYRTISDPIFTEWYHKNMAGPAINGCEANWPMDESTTALVNPFNPTQHGNLAQTPAQLYQWSSDAPQFPSPGGTIEAIAGQSAGTSSLQLAFKNAADPPSVQVGMLVTFLSPPGGPYAQGTLTIPQATTITSITPLTVGCPSGQTCLTLGLLNPIGGTGSIPTTNIWLIWAFSGVLGQTYSPAIVTLYPVIPPGGCPATGLVTNQMTGGNIDYVTFFYDAAVIGNDAGDADAATIMNYYYNTVVPSAVDCGASTGAWDTHHVWLTDALWASSFSSSRIWPPACRP